jgi:hypothetical protein
MEHLNKHMTVVTEADEQYKRRSVTDQLVQPVV